LVDLVLDSVFLGWNRVFAGWVSGFDVRFWFVAEWGFVFVGGFQ